MFLYIHDILKSAQVESDQFRWGARATKTVLKVNPRKSTEPW